MRMAVARAAGLFELVGNTEEGVLWGGIGEVLEGRRGQSQQQHQSRRQHRREAGGSENEEEDEYTAEGEGEGEELEGDERERVQGRALGDVMDGVLRALGIGGMPMPMPSSSPGVAW